MSNETITDARAALAADGPGAIRAAETGVRAALVALLVEHQALSRESEARELHHFEAEQAMTEALAAIESGQRELAVNILRKALGGTL